MSKADEGYTRPLNHKIKARIIGLTNQPGTREDDETSYHADVTMQAAMGYDVLRDLLFAMGFEHPNFVAELPEEMELVPLSTVKVEGHKVRVKSSGRLVFKTNAVNLVGWEIQRTSETSVNVTFKMKCIPVMDDWIDLMRLRLDCHAGRAFTFEFGAPNEQIPGLDEADDANGEEVSE